MKNRSVSALLSFPLALALALPMIACGGDDDGGGGSNCDTSTLTYANFGETFFNDYCTTCHSAGAAVRQSPDLDTLEAVQAQAGRVNARAGNGLTMPPLDPRPSAEERAFLSEWISCGAL